MGFAWTNKQEAFLKANAHLTDREAAEHVSKLGPARTDDAVSKRRRQLGLGRYKVERPSAPSLTVAPKKDVLAGFNEARDAAFVRSVLVGLAELRGLKVAA